MKTNFYKVLAVLFCAAGIVLFFVGANICAYCFSFWLSYLFFCVATLDKWNRTETAKEP